MCEEAEVNYVDGDVVWVKLGTCWWPGEVVDPEKLPPDVLPAFRKPPIAVVKFYQENTYEYVRKENAIEKYNSSRKAEFIQRGLCLYRTKHGLMEKFPEDVIRAESAVGGDPEILTRDEFQETKKESYANLFGDPRKKSPSCIKKGSARGKSVDSPRLATPIRKVKDKVNYKAHILVQGCKTPSQVTETDTTPAVQTTDSEDCEEKPDEESEKNPEPTTSQNATSCAGIYACHACPFTTTRMNVLILHNKTHSSTFTPYIPSPVKKKPTAIKVQKQPSNTMTPPKPRQPRPENIEKTVKEKTGEKREGDEENLPDIKKIKTDVEIKSSLLADWEDAEDDSNDESSTIPIARSPEVPVAGSPAIPTPAEQHIAQVPNEIPTPVSHHQKKDDIVILDKSEASNDTKYDFCEDEDWPVEADVGRKIPRVKPSIRKEEKKSLSIDDDEMAREIAELLNKTTVPELPTVPETFKTEENFPEPSTVKSPDKCGNSKEICKLLENKTSVTLPQPTKTIFKTKTFFRSRHSRSQDAIGKYVTGQLNAAERMNMNDIDLNGTGTTLSPQPRISPPPSEPVKVARLAPKIQLKKMKAEAAQLKEQEKINTEKSKVNDDKSDIFFVSEKTRPLNDNNCVTKQTSTSNEIVNMNECESLKTVNNIPTKTFPEALIENNHSLVTSSEIVKNGRANDEVGKVTLQNSKIINTEEKAQDLYEPYMNESTASAVDALLSVSREADRVTKVVSVDPPEDLFEDDKDIALDNKTDAITFHATKETKNTNTNEEIEKEDYKSSEDILYTNAQEYLDTNKQIDSKPLSPTHSPRVGDDKPNFSEKEHVNELELDNSEVVIDPRCNEQALNMMTDITPSESDLQIAEALINLPSTTITNKSITDLQQHNLSHISPTDDNQSASNGILISTSTCIDSIKNDNIIKICEKIAPVSTPLVTTNVRFESEEEKSENLNAAQSLVEMSESVEHKINIGDIRPEDANLIIASGTSESLFVTKLDKSTSESNILTIPNNNKKDENVPETMLKTDTTSKLLKILEDPCTSRIKVENNSLTNKQVIGTGKDKIINFEVGKSSIKQKQPPIKQKIIIRRTTPKTLLNAMSEVTTTTDQIILSPSNKTVNDGSPVQSYTIQTTPDIRQSDGNTILIQPKFRKIAKPAPKIQKTNPVVAVSNNLNNKEAKTNETVYDINSMPVVLSDDIFTPENIEKMPVVMSDGNLLRSAPSSSKIVKNKKLFVNNEKITVSSTPNKPEFKTVLMNPSQEVNKVKVTTPNILSKSSKLKSGKPILIIDKNTGKQKVLVSKTDSSTRDLKQSPTIIQAVPQQGSPKTEKFIIMPSAASPKYARTQKIIIDPQTRKAHVVVGKGSDASCCADTKPVSAKLISPIADSNTPGNTVMIITNAQGGQSRIVLTPEHEKLLFPNKQQPNVSQLKTITQRVATSSVSQPKQIVTATATSKTQTRVVSKKNAFITSKGQLIVGGRLAAATPNIAPLPEIRPAPKRPTEVKKNVPPVQKTEPLIFLQQKSGTVMQLTAAQFEHLQRTGQIVQKLPVPAQENRVIIQKSISLPSTETNVTQHKQRIRRNQIVSADSPTPPKKIKQEIAIAPAPMPSLTPIIPTNSLLNTHTSVSTICNTITPVSTYPELENFEEMLPANAIVRQTEPIVAEPEPVFPAPGIPAAPLSDGQLLAVPGENFGGPPGSFYLCVEENGTFTAIDNRPLILENNQLVPMVEPIQVVAPQPERRDILEAALVNSEVFHADPVRDEAPDFRDLNANVSVHCRVSETSTTLNQPIMTPVEVPTKGEPEAVIPASLDDGLAVIGVTPHTVPTSLELPITVTDPRIAPKTTNPLSSNNYRTSLLPSPNTEMTFFVSEESNIPVVGPISMPLLTELTGDESIGKSMPILTDDLAERNVSSIESTTIESPCSVEVRESETEDGSQWPRRLLTPASDMSETSVEIPLQPTLQLSLDDLTQRTS
ncbi:uncharacterized protein LOC126966831 [Leptidea sinapis]|uniref:uncharacterized protein LOC126966831 n=1 Tax=Leptidea sinapis TaxID=189913 RepID=UPI0021436D3E|nr:uncharacterized protein LOC126966831 [Leptidea sinapis]